jgi:hypothetical protein
VLPAWADVDTRRDPWREGAGEWKEEDRDILSFGVENASASTSGSDSASATPGGEEAVVEKEEERLRTRRGYTWLYRGGGASRSRSLVKAKISSMEEKTLQFRLCKLMESALLC